MDNKSSTVRQLGPGSRRVPGRPNLVQLEPYPRILINSFRYPADKEMRSNNVYTLCYVTRARRVLCLRLLA
jgi:hypothetical protein